MEQRADTRRPLLCLRRRRRRRCRSAYRRRAAFKHGCSPRLAAKEAQELLARDVVGEAVAAGKDGGHEAARRYLPRARLIVDESGPPHLVRLDAPDEADLTSVERVHEALEGAKKVVDDATKLAAAAAAALAAAAVERALCALGEDSAQQRLG
eukprot:5173484-Pleurochrysis_carterae.AAC.1